MTNSTLITSDVWNHPKVFVIRTLFYVVSPNETSYKTAEEVPNYVDNTVPYFIIMVLLEMIFNFISGYKSRLPRWDDMYSSVAAGFVSRIPPMLIRNVEGIIYIWVYNNYALYRLDWNSPWTWWLSMIGVDIGYYWAHRAVHEVNFLWAAHQVHHSSEDYNLSTAMRQSVLQRYIIWIFYLPLAFFIPPSVFLVHLQFNLIYQFWIHTEVVNTLGPLEWILNTPSHHRVHHGRNRYCIDKNYGGTLIIFDRIFGTFAKEEKKDDLAYGLVHPIESRDLVYTQFFHWRYILSKSWETKGIGNKISVFLKGPGWTPGKPRLGYTTDIPDIKAPVKKYSRPVSTWWNVYLFSHLFLVAIGREMINSQLQDLPALTTVAIAFYIVWSLTNIGYFYEQKFVAPFSELLRCVVYLLLDAYIFSGVHRSILASMVRATMGVSMVIMMTLSQQRLISNKIKSH